MTRRVGGASLIDALVLFSDQPEVTVAFYRAVGVPLEREQHDEGPVHWASKLGEAHVAVYAAEAAGRAPGRRVGGGNQIGLRVGDLAVAYDAALAAGGASLVEPQDVPWGRRAVVEDPDGRPLELNEAPS